MRFWSPFLRLCGALLPYSGRDIPVQVCFQSFPDSDHVGFHRTFQFPEHGQVKFYSTLVPVQGDEVLEQFYLQHAEHYYRQMENSNRGSVSRKIISKDRTETDQDKNVEVAVDQQKSTTDFDDLASQLS